MAGNVRELATGPASNRPGGQPLVWTPGGWPVTGVPMTPVPGSPIPLR